MIIKVVCPVCYFSGDMEISHSVGMGICPKCGAKIDVELSEENRILNFIQEPKALETRILNFIQEPKALFEYGVISRRGPRDNMTDGENDVTLIHIPTKTAKRFQGTFYDKKYVFSLYEFIIRHKKTTGITAHELLHYLTTYLGDLTELKYEAPEW